MASKDGRTFLSVQVSGAVKAWLAKQARIASRREQTTITMTDVVRGMIDRARARDRRGRRAAA